MGSKLTAMWNNIVGSSSSAEPAPKGVTKINDSLYELYAPEEGSAEVDIIFFHGLQVSDYQNAYWTTWSSDGKDTWPRTMLSTVFPKARMLSVCYDSCARVSATTGRSRLVNISENLREDIILAPKADVGKIRPVILVGHSLGGLVIKKLLMDTFIKKNGLSFDPAKKPEFQILEQFFVQLKGIFYYATPHGGSDLATIAARLPNSSPVLDVLKSFNAETEMLNQDFLDWRRIHKIPAYSLYELEETTYWGLNTVIVKEASARRDSDQYYGARANHISICKPRDTKASTFQRLQEFVSSKALKQINVTRQELPPMSKSMKS